MSPAKKESYRPKIFGHHLPPNSNAWIFMIRAYLDDTGAENFVGFGGFAGKAEIWDSIEPAWREKNGEHGITEFHAKEYSELVPQYAALVLKYPLHLIGYCVDTRSYKEYSPRTLRNPFGTNAFASGASGCAARIFEWLQEWPEEDCDLIIDCQPSYSHSIADCINSEAKRVKRNPLLSLTTLNDENRSEFPMRQVADLGANLTARHVAALHYKLRVEKDLSQRFKEGGHYLGITHAPADNIDKMADIFTDPNWQRFYDF